MGGASHRVVGLVAPGGRDGCERLVAALEAALPIRFEERRPNAWRGLDGAIVLDGDVAAGESAAAAGVPCLVAPAPGPRAPGEVRFADDPHLDPRLRGRCLLDETARGNAVPAAPGDVVLASCDGAPIWTVRTTGASALELVASAPRALGPTEPLRSLLTAGRFFALLALVHFLRRLCSEAGWTPPPLRAAFIIDDPNLHWTSYGPVHYRELATCAARHGYHVAIAMVPLDRWFTHAATARLFREARGSISLVVHGNNHAPRELAPPSEVAGLGILAQALRRIGAFERRWGLSVARIMAPPHGVCSEPAARCMLRLGFEAMCIKPAYPWRPGPPASRPLAEWEPCEFVAGGLPVLPRHRVDWRRDELVLTAFLDQPLLVYGHPRDLGDGLDVLDEIALQLGSLGAIRWTSPLRIARSNFASRREGTVLAVRPYARRVHVRMPEWADAVRVELPSAGASAFTHVECTPGAASLELAMAVVGAVDAAAVPPPPPRVWPIVRRTLAEGRDRMTALLPA